MHTMLVAKSVFTMISRSMTIIFKFSEQKVSIFQGQVEEKRRGAKIFPKS